MALGEAIETQGERVADLGAIDERGEQIVALASGSTTQGAQASPSWASAWSKAAST